MITEGAGIPLAVSLTGGNRNDITQLIPLVEAIPPVRSRRGRPRRRPKVIYADRGYDHDSHRRRVHAKGIGTRIARRSTEHGTVWNFLGEAVIRDAGAVALAERIISV